MTGLAPGDRVVLLRSIHAGPEGATHLTPGDLGTIERIGDHFVAVAVNGILSTVPRDDVVRSPEGRITRPGA